MEDVARPRGVALVFPGQGSQRPGAGDAWQGSDAWHVVEEAGWALGAAGPDLVRSLLLEADAEELRGPREAQLAVFAASMLALHDLRSRLPGLQPVAVAGHSLGLYSALVAAGVLEPAAAAALVAERGAAMADAAVARPGAMSAVLGLDDDVVAQVCGEVGDVWSANVNAPRHVVVSGSAPALDRAAVALREAGARRVLPIPVGGAFHTPLMAPARRRLDAALDQVAFAAAAVPVVPDVAPELAPEGACWRELLSTQLTAPVRWREVVASLVARGTTHVVELGPGGVLAGLVRRCAPGLTVSTAGTPEEVATVALELGAGPRAEEEVA